MIQIPLNRFLDAVGEFRFRQPAQFFMDFRRVDGVAAVMAFTVRDMMDEAFRFAQFFANQFDDVDIPHFIVAADVIDFADTAFLEDEVDGPAMVFDIEPVADIEAVPIDRQRLVMQGIDNHEGNQLFRKMIRPIVIGAAADGHRQAISPMIGQNQEVSRSLGGTVRTGCVDRRCFRKEQIRPVQGQIAINFIRRYLMIPLNTVLAAGIHEHSRPHDIRFQENRRILNRPVDMRFRRKIDDYIRMLLFKQPINCIAVADISLDKTEIILVHNRCQRRQIPGIRQLIQTNNPFLRVLLQHMKHKIRPNETGTAGDDDVHAIACSFYTNYLYTISGSWLVASKYTLINYEPLPTNPAKIALLLLFSNTGHKGFFRTV